MATINLELIYSDIEIVERRIDRAKKILKGDKSVQKEIDLLEKVLETLNNGKKAIKLFDTQLQAIEYAKALAINQEASIMIHKEDGTFRKLRYDKPNK